MEMLFCLRHFVRTVLLLEKSHFFSVFHPCALFIFSMSERKKSFCAGAPACYHAAVPSPFPSPHSVSLLHSDPLSSLCLAQGPPPTIPTPRTSCIRGGTGKASEQDVLPSEHRPNPLGARASAQLWGHKDTPRPGHVEPSVCPRACPGAEQGPLVPSRVPWG